MNSFDEDMPDLADGDDRPGLIDDAELEFFEDPNGADDTDEDDDETDDADDYPEDASDEDLDFAIALYREDGRPVAQALGLETINDLEELIDVVRRLPGDAGASGVVSIAGEFFVAVRVRGRHVQALLSDGPAADDWPIARDIVDYLGIDPPEDDDDGPVGDLAIYADLGLSEMDMQALCLDFDEESDELALAVLTRIGFGDVARETIDAEFG